MTDPFTNKAEELLEDLYTATHKGSTLQEGLKDGDIDASDFRDTLKQLTQLHHEEVERMTKNARRAVALRFRDELTSVPKDSIYGTLNELLDLYDTERNRLNKGEEV